MTQQVDWRELSGAGATTPPNLEPRSRSEGDLNRNSYRGSKFDRLATRAVVNDDGTQINERVEALLKELVDASNRIESLLRVISQRK